MAVTHGAKVEVLDHIAEQLGADSHTVEQIRGSASHAVSTLASAWKGPDMETFEGHWRSSEQHLVTAGAALGELASFLREQSQQQQATSSAAAFGMSAGTGLPTGPGGAPGGSGGGDGVGTGNPDITDDVDAEYERIDGPVVNDGVQPGDVRQGSLGDCWLISSLRGVAAANPELLENNIKDNGDGTYDVTLYEDGEPFVVTVTDEFPASDGDPVYANNDRGGRELWPLLYEKAMAQHGGDYDDLNYDWPERALESLTGQEVTTYDEGWLPWDNKDLPPAADLRATLDNGGVIIASTDGDGEKASDGELVSRHAYTVTGIDERGNVTVQNPWGAAHPPITMTYDEFEERFARFDVAATK